MAALLLMEKAYQLINICVQPQDIVNETENIERLRRRAKREFLVNERNSSRRQLASNIFIFCTIFVKY